MADDIVVRNQTEEALRDANQFNIEIVSQAGEGIVVYDRDLRYVVWNRFMERMTGAAAEDVIGKNSFDLFPHLNEKGVDRLLTRALNGETVTSPDIQFYSAFTNQKGWVAGTYAPHILGYFSPQVIDVGMPTFLLDCFIRDGFAVKKPGVGDVWRVSWTWKENFIAFLK